MKESFEVLEALTGAGLEELYRLRNAVDMLDTLDSTRIVERERDRARTEYRILEPTMFDDSVSTERMERLAETQLAEFDWGMDGDGPMRFTLMPLGKVMLDLRDRG